MRNKRYKNGFTLAELLLALIVASIITAAVATLAFALSSANDSTDDTNQKQAQIRYATLRISELVRHCKMICGQPGGDLAVWRADENDDGQININELVYIEKGAGSDYLRLCVFPSSVTTHVNLVDIDFSLTSIYEVTYVNLIPQCSNVQFSLDLVPPNSRFVSISLDTLENGAVRRYQINAAIRGWAGNLLNDTGDSIISDDD
ncbi:MAG: type II secretion system protein [Phycisphaerales bacterium]|jgi:prepilin-type N-terminal cleavage/methylation domain-containing protein